MHQYTRSIEQGFLEYDQSAMGLQRITRDPWSCAGLQDGGHWHCGLCWVARHKGHKGPILTVADLGVFSRFFDGRKNQLVSQTLIYIIYIYI